MYSWEYKSLTVDLKPSCEALPGLQWLSRWKKKHLARTLDQNIQEIIMILDFHCLCVKKDGHNCKRCCVIPPLPQGPSRAANMILRGMKIHCQRAMLSNLSCLSQISNNELLLVQWRHVFNSNKKHLRRRCHDSQATGSKLQRNYSAAPQSFNGSRWVASRLWNVWCTLRDCSFADADVSRFSLSLCLCLLTGTATMLRTWYTRHTLNNGKYPDT